MATSTLGKLGVFITSTFQSNEILAEGGPNVKVRDRANCTEFKSLGVEEFRSSGVQLHRSSANSASAVCREYGIRASSTHPDSGALFCRRWLLILEAGGPLFRCQAGFIEQFDGRPRFVGQALRDSQPVIGNLLAR